MTCGLSKEKRFFAEIGPCGLQIRYGLSKQNLFFSRKLGPANYIPGADYSPENMILRGSWESISK